MSQALLSWVLPLVALIGIAQAVPAVEVDWVSVNDPGNVCDPQFQGCFGSVAYSYRISRFETTNSQYAEFLNAVARADPNSLYNTFMAEPPFGGIRRSGGGGELPLQPECGPRRQASELRVLL